MEASSTGITNYDSRSTGNGLSDAGSTPAWSTQKSGELMVCRFFVLERY